MALVGRLATTFLVSMAIWLVAFIVLAAVGAEFSKSNLMVGGVAGVFFSTTYDLIWRS